uniref:Uncharacterized protein n=1 Tax=Candidatus Kentrum sp. TUN TaxID=2126343 RepID=A0A451AN19_9GAMM|nr:MAG: hypothetical protein BECKTUN1418F_GA0071002_11602 [Candidatus Kentron sp. TUN]VFK67440.1 MAG: hypothetical protein BECKTUN1418E_GA0071001_11472 [Candidatus Kentron sp. TUN]
MKKIELDNWREFFHACDKLDTKRERIFSEANLPGYVSPFLFRGQANADWPLADTLERAAGEKDVGVLQYYGTILSVKPEIERFTGRILDGVPSYGEYRMALNSIQHSVDQNTILSKIFNLAVKEDKYSEAAALCFLFQRIPSE